MCGRFTLKTPPDQWGQLLLPLVDTARVAQAWEPRYNIAPTQDIVAIANVQDHLLADHYRWGLVPGWAKELSIGNRMINARAETLLERKAFSEPLARRRCLIVADGYFEWIKTEDGKQPYWITPKSSPILLLAGLWDENTWATGKRVKSCTIITTAATSKLAHIHDRMPAMLSQDAAEHWLAPDYSAQDAQSLLVPADGDSLEAAPVNRIVNNARNEVPECIEPIGQS